MQVHRFRDVVGIALKGKGETRYMNADQAERAGRALLAAARSIRREGFTEASGLTVKFVTYQYPHEPPAGHRLPRSNRR